MDVTWIRTGDIRIYIVITAALCNDHISSGGQFREIFLMQLYLDTFNNDLKQYKSQEKLWLVYNFIQSVLMLLNLSSLLGHSAEKDY